MISKIDESKKEMENYAIEISKAIKGSTENKKFYLSFLKDLNDLLCVKISDNELNDIEKEITNIFNRKVKENHDKNKANTKKEKKKIKLTAKHEEDYADDYDYDDYDDADY